MIHQYKLGGYILFARDFKTFSPEEVYLNIGSYQNVSKIPMLIAVDEEGGRVSRLKGLRGFAYLDQETIVKFSSKYTCLTSSTISLVPYIVVISSLLLS